MIEDNQDDYSDRKSSNFDQQYENPFESLLDEETAPKMERTQEGEQNDDDFDLETSYQQRDDEELNIGVDRLPSSLMSDTQTGKDDHSFTTQEDDEALRLLNDENVPTEEGLPGFNPFNDDDDDDDDKEDNNVLKNESVASDPNHLGKEENEEEGAHFHQQVKDAFSENVADSVSINGYSYTIDDFQAKREDQFFTTKEDDEVLRVINDENVVTEVGISGLNPFDDDDDDDDDYDEDDDDEDEAKNVSAAIIEEIQNPKQVVDDFPVDKSSLVGDTQIDRDDRSFTTQEDDEVLRMLNDENVFEEVGISGLNPFDDDDDDDDDDYVEKSSAIVNHSDAMTNGDGYASFNQPSWVIEPINDHKSMGQLNPFDDDVDDDDNDVDDEFKTSTKGSDFNDFEEESYEEKRLRAKQLLEEEIRLADELKYKELSRIRAEGIHNERTGESGEDTALSVEAESNDTDYMSYDDDEISTDGVRAEEEKKEHERISIASLDISELSQVQLMQSILLAEEASVNGDDEFRTVDKSFDDLSRVYISPDILREKSRAEKIKETSKMILDRTLTTAKMSQSHAEKHLKSLKMSIDTKITELRKTKEPSPSSQHEVDEFV